MKFKQCLTLFLLCVLSYTSQATTDDPTDNEHFGYIENKGQIHDQNGNARNDIRYMYYNDKFRVILRTTGFSYEFMRTDYLQPDNTESGTPKEIEDENEVEYTAQYTVNRIDVDFVNANSNMDVVSEGSSPFYRNYFNEYTGYKGIKRIHSYYTVTYKNIYNGIDLVFSSEKEANGKIYPKYEFLVHPNGNIADIALNYKGDFQFSVVNDGSLKLNTNLGYVNETTPVILFNDNRISEKGKFIRHGSTVSFSSVKRNAGETFTIDPTIEWGTYWGGLDKDLTDEIAVDLDQNILITGRTRSTSSFSTSGAYQETNAGALDIPIMKWDPSGNLIYATYYGGHDNEIAFCVTVDPYNQIWIGGHTFSLEGIATPGAMQDHFVGPNYDGLLSKFSTDGDLIYGTYFGGTGEDELQNIWADTDGSIYGSGFAESLTGIIFSPCFDCTGSTEGAVVLMKFDNYGTQIWANYWGGTGRDRGHGVTIFGNNLYQCGTVLSKSVVGYGNPGGNAFHAVKSGLNDVMLGRWDKNTGIPIWVTYYGGNDDERGRDVRCDRDGFIYFTGQTESPGMSTPGAWKVTIDTINSDKDGYVAKFDSNCNRIWGTYFGGPGIDFPRSLRVAPEGAPVYVAGYTKSASDFVTGDAFDKKNKKNNDAFWVKFNWDASLLQYATYYGGKKAESVTEPGWYGPTMDLDANNNLYLSSGTDSEDGIAYSDSAYKDTLAAVNQYDFFLAKFADPCPDGFEPNDAFSQATLLRFRSGNTITRYAPIQVRNDKDYFVFNTTGVNNNLRVTLTGLPFDCDIYVYDSVQNLLGKSINSGITDEVVIINGTYVGRYFVLVKSPTHEFGYVCYTLTADMSTVPFRLSNESALGDISLYPNPADHSTSLQFESNWSGEYQITICDLQGRIMLSMQQQLETGNQVITLPLQQLPVGAYLVKVNGVGMNDVVKLIIQK